MLRRILIANRGEIACRIERTLDRLGTESVAVYSEADAGAPHVRQATRACAIGPSPVEQSYLRGDRILEVARDHGCDGIHPGYGLLSENPGFAAACEDAGIAFLGPTPAQIEAFGQKHTARDLAEQAGVPLLAGTGLLDDLDQARGAAAELGYPVLLKTTAGGGGIGMARCDDDDALVAAWESVRRLGSAHFGAADVFLERFVARARHVEVQIFGDGRGRVRSLGTRDCSLQRRRQKVLEEAPAPFLSDALQEALETAALRLGESVAYRSAGTVEFLVDVDREEFSFLEVNARLQVEHPVTEAVHGIDLVEWMVRLASGETAFLEHAAPQVQGHAIEVRLYAEDPSRDDRPSQGTLAEVRWPEGVRVDGWVEPGTVLTPFYDPMLAKLIVHGGSRDEALTTLRRALGETRLGGVVTNLDQLRAAVEWPTFCEGRHHTTSLADLTWRRDEIEVLASPGVVSAHDDPGRLGSWGVGVPPSGPMDPLSPAIGNRCLGNRAGLTTLEIAVEGPRLHFTCERWVALTGASADVHVDGAEVDARSPFLVPAGSVLQVGAIRGLGARAYLCVQGGLALPKVLGSEATFTLGGFGGTDGRSLRAGDLLPLGDPDDATRRPDELLREPGSALPRPEPTAEWRIGVLEGPHADPEFVLDEGLEAFYGTDFEVHYQSSRTGVRLIGPKPLWARKDGGDAGLHPSNLHDTAYSIGAIDFTGDMPVILGPDGPSLGGFVCPAVVASAERWKIGQLRPGDRVRFHPLTPAAAERARREQRDALSTRGPAGRLVAELPSPARGEAILSRAPAEGERPSRTIRQSGDRAILVEYGPMQLDLDLRIRIQLLLQALEDGELQRSGALIDLTPGIRSLQLHFDPDVIDAATLIRAVEELDLGLPNGDGLRLPTRIVHMPLSFDDPATREAIAKYEEVVRPDAPWCPSNLEFIRRINGLASIEEVRKVVFDARYLVLGLGDVYLGAPVATPVDPRHRLVTTKYNPARTWTPENAVGIGGAYLCIYGMEGPGGYQFVGRTVPIWSTFGRARGTSAERPWLLRSFDQIRFTPVEPEELLELREQMRQGRLALEIEESEFDVGAHRRFLASAESEITAFRDRQRRAFDEERQRWEASGEFQAAADAADRGAAPSAADDLVLAKGEASVDSPLGAMVYHVAVAEGDLVEEGAELLVLSAMKTETPVTAPCAGRVTRVVCEAGQVVLAGAPLVVIAAAGAEG